MGGKVTKVAVDKEGANAQAAQAHAALAIEAAPVLDPNSLFARLGGKVALSAVVDRFYERVMADAVLSPYFAGVSMISQRKKQVDFLTFALGGNTKYSIKEVFVAHAQLIRDKGLNLTHFDLVAEHLLDTLLELNVAVDLVEEVGRKVLDLEPLFDPVRFDANCKTYGIPSYERPDSLYTRIGGAPAVQAVVEVFYKFVLSDPLLSPFFEGMDMEKQRAKQVSFVSMAFGSSKKYTGANMFKAHERMIREQGLGLEHFDAVAGHLVAAMKQLEVPQKLIDEAVTIVMSLRPVFDPAQNGVTAEDPNTLYTRIGGAPAVQATVDVFYKRVLADPLLSPFFEGIDMSKQRAKQVSFVSMAFGSSKKYTGADMFKAHERMIREQGLGLEHFDAVAGHLVAAMKQLEVPQKLIDEAVTIVMSLRPVFDPAHNGTA